VQVERVLQRQSGMVSRAQALAAGMSRHQVDRLVAARRWLPIYPGVYLVADRELTEEGRVWAAALWAGDDATVSGLAAAWWHGLRLKPLSIVEVTASRSSGKRRARGIRVRRRSLVAVDRVLVRGVPVTDVPLTVLDAAVQLGDRGSQLVDHALQRRVSLDALRQAHARNLGGRGSAAAAGLLSAAADRAASAAERKAIALFRAAGLAGWRQHYRLCGYSWISPSQTSRWRSRWTVGPGTTMRRASSGTGSGRTP
jgi:Transcriptional regulator, AbiEi antitoxin